MLINFRISSAAMPIISFRTFQKLILDNLLAIMCIKAKILS